MELKGTVEGIVFRNAENGYTVLAVDVHGLIITAVGIFPPITEGENVTLIGEYKTNSRFGEQFVVNEVVVVPPTNEEGMIRYLSSGLFKGIGEITASAIVRKFGKDTFDIIQYNPTRLAEVRGISAKKSEEISVKFEQLRSMQNTIMFLTKHGVSLNLSMKIYKLYGVLSESIVRTNPYRMVGEVEGIGFRTADIIATSMGIEHENPNRIKAAIRYVLDEIASRSGHTYLPVGRIIAECNKVLAFTDEQKPLIEDAISDMETLNEIVRINTAKSSGMMLDKYFNLENSIAKRLVTIMDEARPLTLNFDREIEFYQKINNITLHPTQKEAIAMALNSGAVVITGGPGTGKTTIIKCIIYLLERMGITYSLTAPTGRASKRMSEATGRNAATIHRLLEFNKSAESTFVYNERNPLTQDVYIVDEVSMADEFIFNALLRAMPRTSKLILVGDKDQLPSVGAGSVLADVIQSDLMPVIALSHIYRQAEDSFIVTNAHLINKGIMPEPDKRSSDFFFDYQTDARTALDHTIQFCTKRIVNYLNVSPDDIQVLAPLKKGDIGVIALNKALQNALNPSSFSKKEITVGQTVFREGDRVIQVSNNYDILWERVDGEESTNGEGVFNGDIGKIVAIDKGEMRVTVRFEDGRIATYPPENLDQLALAYAISVHKSQGSEFKVVILVVERYNPMVLSKNLLYTAVTRAKNMVVLIGGRETYDKMAKNKYTERRMTALVEFIDQYRNEN